MSIVKIFANNYLLIICILSIKTFAQCDVWKQNLLHNAEFEIGSTEPRFPGKDFEYISVWKSQMNTYKPPGITDPNYYIYYHSPDWFEYPYFPSFGVAPYNNYGTHYIGMSDYELVQQQFFNDNQFDEGKSYILKLNLYLPSYYYWNGYTDFNNSFLRFYAAKKQIKYKNENCQPSDLCSKNYKAFKDQVGQDIIVLQTLDLSVYSIDQWHKVLLPVTAPNSNYDWFCIEVVNRSDFGYNCQWAYVLLDNISLSKGCINNCSSTDGIASICITNHHTDNEPLTISGLNNISKVKFSISTLIGQYPIWSKTINYPPNIIAWDGTEGIYGTQVSSATYEYKVELFNDCDDNEIFTGKFTKVTTSGSTYFSPFFDYSGGVSKPPDPCCALATDMFIYNQTLRQDKTIFSDSPVNSINPPLLYKSVNNITALNVLIPVNTSVFTSSTNEVLFQAGNDIELLPGFEVEFGADFTAEIVPCGSPFYKNSNYHTLINNTNLDTNSSITSDSTYSSREISSSDISNSGINENKQKSTNQYIILTPNPNNGNMTVQYTIPEYEQGVFEMYDLLGKKVYSKFMEGVNNSFTINELNLCKGIYFYQATSNGRKIGQGKIVIIK